MGIQSTTQWFVEPIGGWTNEITASFLEVSQSPAEQMHCEDDKGEPREVWLLPNYDALLKLNASVKTFNLRYRVYTRDNSLGPIHLAFGPFQPQKKKKHFRKPKLKAASRL